MNKKHHFLLLSLMIVLGAMFSFPSLGKSMIAEADAYSRVNTALDQIDRGLLFNKFGGTWLPLHFTIMVPLLLIFGNSFITPRLLTLVLSLGSIVLIYFYTKFFTKNKIISLLSSLLLLLFPLRIYLSTQTLSEPVFLFFFTLSLLPILKNKLSNREIFFSLFFLNIAHGIRYESWMILPLIWFFIASKPIGLKKKLFFILFSTAFPLYWLYLNGVYTGSFLTFFYEKYEVAQNHERSEYFNFSLSLSSWVDRLIPIFPASFLFCSFFDFKNLFKKFSFQNIFYYSLPLFLFLLLVAQVFLGTMEWFPTRYLLIPTMFLIPLLASFLYKLYIFLYALFLKQNLISKIFSLLLSFMFMFIFQYQYFNSLRYTRLEINDASFLGSYNSYETIEDSSLYADFLNLVKECDDTCDDKISFFYDEKKKTYLDQALFYFLVRPGTYLSKKRINNFIVKDSVFIWERSQSDETNLIKEFDLLYKNKRFYILKG